MAVCMLCLFAAVLCLSFSALAGNGSFAFADEQNVFLNSEDKSAVTDSEIEWTYGDGAIISYTLRPQHGDTVFYTLSSNGQEQDKFAVVYVGDTALLYEVENGNADLEKPFRVNSLNAYLRTLKTGEFSLTVSAPAGQAEAGHTHWYDGDTTCGTTAYSAVTHTLSLKINAYEITQSNLGESSSADESVTLKYTIQNPEVLYTGEANNLPKIELTLTTDDGTLVLVEGEDYTLSSDTVNASTEKNASLTITGIGGFTGEVTVENAYQISKGDNSVSDVYVVRWKYGEYDRQVNLFTANAKWGEDGLYFAISSELNGSFIKGLDEIRLNEDGMVEPQVEQLLNGLDAKTKYYLYAIVDGGDNYVTTRDYTQFEVVEVTNTWTTTPNVVSWEWHGFDENVNAINAVPAFGDSVNFKIYKKSGEDYTALQFGEKDSFVLEKTETGVNKMPANVISVLSNLDAGTYYLFASVISDTDNYTSINAQFSAGALVPFRVLQARNYWTQIPQIANWSYGGYDAKINVVSAAAAHGSSGDITYSIYKQNGESYGLIKFGDTTSFKVNSEGAVPAVVSEGLKSLGVGKYYLRAEVEGTNNYTGLQEKGTVADYAELSSFEVLKADNYWGTAPTINSWSEGNYTNEDNLPVAAAHYGVARIVITDVNDAENVLYDSENNINKLAEAGVGAYLLTATVAGSDNYGELTFDRIFHVFVPETATVGIAWWLVLIIVLCSIGVLVFIFWLLHERGIIQMLTRKTVLAIRSKATVDATIASVRVRKVEEEARESVRLAEELDKLEAEKVEVESDDSDEEGEAILISRDEATGMATFVRYQKPFSVKLIQATDEAKEYYSYLKNVLLSYKKVNSKLSKGYDAFNRGRTKLAKLVIRGKTLCLYLALNPDDYAESKYKVERSESKKFADVPCLYRIKNQRRLKYAEELIAEMCEKLALVQGENQNVDYKPAYQSTYELMESGLIKKIVYTRKINAPANDNAEVNSEAEPKSQEAAVTESEASQESEATTEEQLEEAAATQDGESTEEGQPEETAAPEEE